MALPATQTRPAPSETRTSYTGPLALMVALFFGIGFITALNDVLVAHFKDIFHLSNVAALLVPFCFFAAYFVMSLPSGWIVGRIGYKASIVTALSVVTAGLLLFQPASRLITYSLFLFALFVVGSGLALLQVAINPYIGALGMHDTAASRLNLAGGFNSLAGTLAPNLGPMFIFIAAGATTAQLAHSVRGPYLVLALCALAMALVTALTPLPEIIETAATSPTPPISAWRFPHLRLGAVAIFLYVGAEVAIGSIMINYLGQPAMGGMSHAAAARYVSAYWFSAMVGRFIGFGALIKVPAQRALAAVALGGVLLTTIAVLTHGHIALWAVVLCGLCNSVMWPCIFPLALKGLGPSTGQGSGILVTMVVGGALVPLLQGYLADHGGYQHSFIVVLACYAYLLYYALRGHRTRTSAQPTSNVIPLQPEPLL